jgi:hypothetical protein
VSHPSSPLSGADEALLHQLAKPFAAVEDAAPNWFDRFYFNLHPRGAGPLLVVGAGVYPNVGVIDGYACVASGDRQDNIRFSAPFGPLGRATRDVGPLRWEVVEPLRRWQLRLDAPAAGLAADVTFTARTDAYAVEPIAVTHEEGPRTEFWHYFQAGEYTGELEIDGQTHSVDGWRGLRDRSWGMRRVRERLGIHMWGGVQFDDWCLAVNYNEDRAGKVTHLDGAWLPVHGGAPVPVVEFRHDLSFDAAGELEGGAVQARLGDGRRCELAVQSLGRGLYMAGAGYGGWHGQPRGVHEEHDSLPLDGSVSPRSLSLGLVDKLCAYSDGERDGFGVFELAASRSSSYAYRPTLIR